jgi:hypothetical protein
LAFSEIPPKPALGPLASMLKVLAPIVEKLLEMLALILSVAVIIPTSAMIPKAMIAIVRMARSKLPLIDLSANRMFSSKGILSNLKSMVNPQAKVGY